MTDQRGKAKRKLDEDAVVDILTSDDTSYKLAKKYRVALSTVEMVRKGHTWKHVRPELPRLGARYGKNSTKLTQNQIEYIRSSSLPAKVLANQYGISTSLVYRYRNY